MLCFEEERQVKWTRAADDLLTSWMVSELEICFPFFFPVRS